MNSEKQYPLLYIANSTTCVSFTYMFSFVMVLREHFIIWTYQVNGTMDKGHNQLMNKVSFYVLWQLVDYIYTCIEYEFRLTAHYCYSLTSIQRDLRVHKTLTTGDLIQRGLNLNVDCPQNRKILIFALMFTVPQVTPILLPSPIQNDAVRSTLYVQ